uniref:Uncharacterized protein n=1 Tax=Parascaris univalens TaxID=6257 RepID=A0A915A2S0_PARUN
MATLFENLCSHRLFVTAPLEALSVGLIFFNNPQLQPWNRGDPRFAVHIGHDGEVLSKTAVLHSDLPNYLCDACGLLVNERTVYCSRYAHIPIQLAYVMQPCVANIGDRIKFQAMFSIFLNGYVVNVYRKVHSAPSIPYKLSNFGLRALLEVSVKWEGLPFGYVWTRNKQLGIIHDPEGILSAALLSPLRLSVFRVYVTDTGPSAFSRFRLRGLASTLTVDGDNLTKNGHMFVGKLMGISTGNGSVFAPKYGTLEIQFGMKSTVGWERVRPGSWISFTMASDPRPPLFTVIEWERIPKLPLQCFITPNDFQGKGDVTSHLYKRGSKGKLAALRVCLVYFGLMIYKRIIWHLWSVFFCCSLI